MQTSVRVGCFVVLLMAAYGLGAAGKATYYEDFDGSTEVVFTEVDFIDQDAGELASEAEDATYILKNNKNYALVLNAKSGKMVFGLCHSKKYRGVFEIVTYQFCATCPPAGSPGPRR